jgi:DnaK suppressor protein
MNTTNYKLIRLRLENDRKRFSEQLEQFRASRTAEERREGSPFGKREEEATETAELENLVAQEQRIVDQLGDIDTALKKFETSTFGLCEKCGQKIEPARLEAIPTAKLCMSDAQNKNVR